MIRIAFAFSVVALSGAAWAQSLPNVPLPPTVTVQPLPPVAAPRAPVSQFDATPVPKGPQIAPGANNWIPGGAADLRLLDKVTARVSGVTLKAGESRMFGSLTIVMRSCLLRPKDQPADSAAFLDVTDRNGGPGFQGWMFASLPAMAMLEHPGYDIRVSLCQP